MRRLIAALAVPIIGLNYLLLAGSQFNLSLMFLFLIGSAIAGILLANDGAAYDQQSDAQPTMTALLTSAPDALLLVDPLTGKILDCNRRALILFEATQQSELIDCELTSLQRTIASEEQNFSDLSTTSTQGTWLKESVYTTCSGKEFWADLLVTRMTHLGYTVLLVRLIDITVHKDREEKLKKAKADIQTIHAAKSEFLADLSQRILFSVNRALHATTLLHDSDLSPEQQQYADLGRRATDALLTTVNDILDFSNLESGELALEPIAFDLRTTIEDTLARFTGQGAHTGVALTCLLAHDIPTLLWGDPGRLRQILMNVIENALTRSSQEDILVRGDLVHETPTTATFRFSVMADSLNCDHLALLFQGTFQASSVRRASRKEWLGLAVSKNLVKLMGGDMGVERSSTQGGTVWFTVPLEKQPSPALSTPPARNHLRGVRALVVSNLTSSLHRQLLDWGMVSHSETDPSYALQMLTVTAEVEVPYDLVLLSWPEVDQEVLEFASAIRQSTALAALRLVLLTATGRKGDAPRARRAGFDAYLTKPTSQSVLFECLTTVMNQAPKTVAPNVPLVTSYSIAEARAYRRPRALVVTTATESQKLATHLLTQMGYRADVACNYQEGVIAHANRSYAAVLLAWNPLLEGSTLAIAQIRQRDRRDEAYTPIIGLIESGGIDEYENCVATGMDDALILPFTAKDLEDSLERCSTVLLSTLEQILPDLSSGSGTVFDVEEALSRVDGDKSILKDMISVFLQEYPQVLGTIQEAVFHHDSQALVDAAHFFKGSLSNLAAVQAARAALRLETLGRQGDLSLAPLALRQLEDAMARVRPLFTEVITEQAA
ncbi:MAG: Hpt domain-containing protein [Candidatus Binatia bacterium]